MTQERSDILNGWKEIAGYLGRDTRTVERWEKQRGLPVRRVPGAGRATVYAITSELDTWFKSGPLKDAEERIDAVAERSVESGERAVAAERAPVAVLERPEPPEPLEQVDTLPEVRTDAAGDEKPALQPARRSILSRLLPVAALLCVAAAVLWAVSHRAAPSAARSTPAGAANARLAPLSRVAAVNDLVMRGTYAYEQRTPQSLRLAEQCFREAMTRDAGYAPAYAGLADTYLLLREYSAMPDSEAYPLALAAARQAVALDPALPQAHTSLGFIDFFWLAQPGAAEHEFKTSLALDPRLTLGHHWYGSVLTHEGRYKQALEELSEAQRLSPNSAAILSTRALALGLSGRRQEAIGLLEEVLTESPGTSAPHQVIAILALTPPRDMRLYLKEFDAAAEVRHDKAQIRDNEQVRAAYERGGDRAMWEYWLAEEEKAHPAPAPRTLRMAVFEFALGRIDDGFRDVQVAISQHERGLVTIQMDPVIGPDVRADARYRKVLDQIGLLPLLPPDTVAQGH